MDAEEKTLTPEAGNDSADVVDAGNKILDDFFEDFQDFKPNTTRRIMGGGSGKPSISVVNSTRNGKRITITNSLYTLLGSPRKVCFKSKGHELAVASELPKAEAYKFSPDKNSHVIYNANLVLDIVEAFDLDYSKNRTSLSFSDIKMEKFINAEKKEIPVAIITMIVPKDEE